MTGAKIVVIDDCKLNLAIVRDMLEEAGYQVDTAESGIEANQYIYDLRRPDLILIDLVMPLLSGDKKVRSLKARAASKAVPIVLMSHKPESELAALSRQAGADGHLTKPLEKAALLTEIGRLLR